jgi:transcription elongation factor Elf1
MKILKLGVNPDPPVEAPWWGGLIVDCKKCGTQIQLDARDSVSQRVDSPTGQVTKIVLSCPICHDYPEAERPVAQTTMNKYHENKHDAHASQSPDSITASVLG